MQIIFPFNFAINVHLHTDDHVLISLARQNGLYFIH